MTFLFDITIFYVEMPIPQKKEAAAVEIEASCEGPDACECIDGEQACSKDDV